MSNLLLNIIDLPPLFRDLNNASGQALLRGPTSSPLALGLASCFPSYFPIGLYKIGTYRFILVSQTYAFFYGTHCRNYS